ncbi:MAG: DUF1232 domain-containing protein [Moraxellaceae bacterium]|nr:DUF1232 domain-containing protein [Moraxellaceae bacterium]
MAKISSKLNEKVQNYISNPKQVDDADIKKVLDSEDKIQDKLHTKSPIDRFFTDIQLFLGLLKDYYYGNYRKIPYKSIASIVTALLYLINPIDIIPDAIPVIGQIDDALVLGFCLKMIESDLEKYRFWQASTKHTSIKAKQPA